MGTSPNKPVIGIVGGIGAGKSTVARELEDLGCARIDADAIGHELLGDSGVRQFLRRRWGQRVFAADGSVDREAVGDIVFRDPAELAALNEQMHPRIRRRLEQAIAAAQADESVSGIVVDAAVLFEAGWDDLCTHRVFVRAPAEARKRRATAARGWGARTWAEREKSQFSLDIKAAKCEDIIDNSATVLEMRRQVQELFERILQSANHPR